MTAQTPIAKDATGRNVDVKPVMLVSEHGEALTGADNITTKFREAFEAYEVDPQTGIGEVWVQEKAAGDIIQLDGNALASSYLVISKDPLTPGTVTTLETVANFDMPLELAVGLSLSQRTLGQEFAIEVVSTDDEAPGFTDLAISSISQTTTTVTINTTLPHDLVPGKRFGIYGSPDSRFNYPSLVVASIPNKNQITATAGPGGTIPSVTAGVGAGGFLYGRSSLGGSPDGTSMIFENATATNASIYVRGNAGDAYPTGTAAGSHVVTMLSTVSAVAISAAYTYAFLPTTEYRLNMKADRLQWSDIAVDSVAQANARATRTQVMPNPAKDYKLRVRATNNKGYTVPTGQIQSISKTASTTARITFRQPHGLTITDQIILFGVRDQTNFPNLAVATAISTIVNATQIDVVVGPSTTATSYGGFVARANGNNVAIGAVALSIQNATLATVDTVPVLTLTATGTWAGVVIGDYANLYNVTNNVDGALLGIDGAWKVRNLATTTLELEPLPGTTPPADFGSTAAGGAIIKRTDIRLSYARIFDFERLRVETSPSSATDRGGAFPVTVQNNTDTFTTTAAGSVARDSSTSPNPVLTGATARTSAPTAVSANGDMIDAFADMSGRVVNKPLGVPGSQVDGRVVLTTLTETSLIAALASNKTDLQSFTVMNTDTVDHIVDLKTAAAGAIKESVSVKAGDTVYPSYPAGFANDAVNTAWVVQLREAIVTGGKTVECSAKGFRTTG